MHTHRFGRRLKLPATIAIKHQIRKLMFEDLVRKQRELRELKQFACHRAANLNWPSGRVAVTLLFSAS